jgi:hypothetical protein
MTSSASRERYESGDDCDGASNSTRVQRPARKTTSRIQMPSTFFFAQRCDGSGWHHRVSVVVVAYFDFRSACVACVCVCVNESPPFFCGVKMPHILYHSKTRYKNRRCFLDRRQPRSSGQARHRVVPRLGVGLESSLGDVSALEALVLLDRAFERLSGKRLWWGNPRTMMMCTLCARKAARRRRRRRRRWTPMRWR